MELALPRDIANKTNNALKVIDWLEGRYQNWGRPAFDAKSAVFWEMVFDIIKVWERVFAQERLDWEHDKKIDLDNERSLKESVDKGLKKRMAYPPNLYKLLRLYWPNGRFANKEFTQMFMTRFPIFRNSNYT